MVLGKDDSDHCYDIDSSLRIHIDTVILCIYPDRYALQANIGAYHGAYDVSAIYRSRPVPVDIVFFRIRQGSQGAWISGGV